MDAMSSSAAEGASSLADDLGKMATEDEGGEVDKPEERKAKGWRCPFTMAFWKRYKNGSGGDSGERRAHDSFNKMRIRVRVKRAKRLREEALFYGGGHIQEIPDKEKKRRESAKSAAESPSVVCLSYRARSEEAGPDGASATSERIPEPDRSIVSAPAEAAPVEVSAPPVAPLSLPPLPSPPPVPEVIVTRRRPSSERAPPDPPSPTAAAGGVVTQVDYVNYFIPYLKEITACPYYWGKIDRYEAEALLENKPEGSFLLRDSAQDEFVFSVSFRRYNRSLHARIEESRHQFSFDCHDPGVHSSRSVCGLLEHYKDPFSCMFFEPMLLYPVLRRQPFALQEIARAAICDNCTYGNVRQLPLPRTLVSFLRAYSYRHKFRTRQLDVAANAKADEEIKGSA